MYCDWRCRTQQASGSVGGAVLCTLLGNRWMWWAGWALSCCWDKCVPVDLQQLCCRTGVGKGCRVVLHPWVRVIPADSSKLSRATYLAWLNYDNPMYMQRPTKSIHRP